MNPTREQTKALEETCLEAAQAGAQKAMSYFNKTFKISYKGEEKHAGTIVTEADLASERQAVEIIRERHPGQPIIGEENGGSEGNGELKVNFRTTAWDSCATAAIISEAGGKYCNMQGNPWTTKDSDAIGASSEKTLAQALEVLKRA